MSLASLERLFHSVVLPSASYGLRAIIDHLTDTDLQYLTLVQCRLLKFWWGVSKFASNSQILAESGWSKAGDILIDHFRSGARLPCLTSDDAHSSNTVNLSGNLRKVMGRWIGTAFHNLWCRSINCYHLTTSCSCKLCGTQYPLAREHLSNCRWLADCNLPLEENLLKIERILYSMKLWWLPNLFHNYLVHIGLIVNHHIQ